MRLLLQRSVGVLVVIVEVSGDDDVSMNVYHTPVPPVALTDLPIIVSPRENATLFMLSPLKKSISHAL